MGDCFAQYPFLDVSYDTDERYQKVCKQLCAHNMWIRSVLIFSPKHPINDIMYPKLVATCGDDEYFKLWDVQTTYNVAKYRLSFVMNCIEELNYTENDTSKQLFVIGGEFGRLIVYDYSTNTIVKELTGSSRNILSIKVLPNKQNPNSKNSVIISGNSRGEVRFWNWQKGTTIHRIKLGISPVQGLCYWGNPASEGMKNVPQMVMNTYEHRINIWRTAKVMRKVKQISEHTNWVRSLLLKTVRQPGEGKRISTTVIVSSGDDNTIRFFNLRSGACLRILEAHSSGVIHMEMFMNSLLSCESCGRIAVTQLETMKTYYIATGLCFDYYKGFSIECNDNNNEAYLSVVGSSPKKSSYHFLNIYRGKVVDQRMVFDI